jgi:hypothetical protein
MFMHGHSAPTSAIQSSVIFLAISQVAQRSMLQLRHRIIPILFEDFDLMKSDANLRWILASITYLKWDPAKPSSFWRRLERILSSKQKQ